MESMQQSMGTDKESNNRQCMLQNEARQAKERYEEADNLTEHYNHQQHTIRALQPSAAHNLGSSIELQFTLPVP
jgi:hypothetical protein